MTHLKRVGLACAMTVLLAGCLVATPASATTICVGGTVTAPCSDGHPGGPFTLTSVNSQLLIHGSSSIQCTHGTIAGTAPATSATTLVVPVTLAYTGCTALSGLVPATVTVPAPCLDGGASAIRATVMYNQATAPQATATVTIPAGCVIVITIPAATCTITIPGEQTIGATGGINWTNGNASTRSFAELNNALVPDIVVHPGGGFGCPPPGTHTGTLVGTYSVSFPTAAPGVTVIP